MNEWVGEQSKQTREPCKGAALYLRPNFKQFTHGPILIYFEPLHNRIFLCYQDAQDAYTKLSSILRGRDERNIQWMEFPSTESKYVKSTPPRLICVIEQVNQVCWFCNLEYLSWSHSRCFYSLNRTYATSLFWHSLISVLKNRNCILPTVTPLTN